MLIYLLLGVYITRSTFGKYTTIKIQYVKLININTFILYYPEYTTEFIKCK